MTTEILNLPEMTEAQGGKTLLYNENLRRLEAVLIRVLARTGAVPGSPANGDTHIVTGGTTGDWASATVNDIAHYYNNAWEFYSPVEGMRLWVNDEDVVYVYDGTAWQINQSVDLTQDTTFSGTFLHLDRGTTGSATIRCKGNGTSSTGTIRAEGDSAFDCGIFETRDAGSSNIWRWRHTGSDAGTRPDVLSFQYSPNDGVNNHEALRMHPDQSTANNDPTGIEVMGKLDQNREQERVQQAYFTLADDARYRRVMFRGQTINATQTEIFLDGSSARLGIVTDTSWTFRMLFHARRTNGANEAAGYQVTGVIRRDGVTTALTGSITKTVIAEDTAAWDVTVEADDTNDALVVKVTGEAAKTIRWVVACELVEITG